MKPRKLNSGRWTVQIMVDGKRFSVTEDTKSACINRAKALKREPAEKPKKVTLSWGDAIDMFIDNSQNVLSPSTIKTYRSTSRNHFQDIMDMDITEPINWQVEINKEAGKMSAKGVKNCWGLITATMSFHGMTAPKVRLPQVVRSERPFLDVDQIKILMEAVKDTTLEIPVLLMLNGLRRSEALALKRKDIDLKNRNIRIQRAIVAGEYGFVEKKTTKNTSSNRVVPILIPRLEQALKKAKDPLVQYAPESLHRAINVVCLRNGLPEVGCHGLRHSMASMCYINGITEEQCMRWGGWSNPGTMRKIYLHLSEKDQNQAAENIRSLFC